MCHRLAHQAIMAISTLLITYTYSRVTPISIFIPSVFIAGAVVLAASERICCAALVQSPEEAATLTSKLVPLLSLRAQDTYQEVITTMNNLSPQH